VIANLSVYLPHLQLVSGVRSVANQHSERAWHQFLSQSNSGIALSPLQCNAGSLYAHYSDWLARHFQHQQGTLRQQCKAAALYCR
jgi:hypothetical protein